MPARQPDAERAGHGSPVVYEAPPHAEKTLVPLPQSPCRAHPGALAEDGGGEGARVLAGRVDGFV